MTPRKWLIIIIAFATFLRVFHGLITHYHVVGDDSFYFHWLATQAGDGHHIDWLHSGITWPLFIFSKLIGIDAAGYIIPLALNAAIIVMIYWLASNMFDTMAGLCAAFMWAILRHAIYITSPQFLDRDALTMILLLGGVCLLYWAMCRDLRWWKLAGVGFILGGIGELVYLEWSYGGRWLYLLVIGILSLVILWRYSRKILYIMAGVAVVSIPLLIAVDMGQTSDDWAARVISDSVVSNNPPVAESSMIEYNIAGLDSLTLNNLFGQYYLALPFLILGYFMLWQNKDVPSLMLVAWFASMFVCAAVMSRIIIVAMPAVVIIAGYALAVVLHSTRKFLAEIPKKRGARIGVVALLAMGLAVIIQGSYLVSAQDIAAIDRPYYRALDCLKSNSPDDARVIGWCNRGRWILDVGERWPVLYVCSDQTCGTDTEVATAYVTSSPYHLAEIMRGLDADYLIFSANENDHLDEIRDMIHVPDLVGPYLLQRIRDGEDPGPLLSVVYAEPGDNGVLVLELIG